MRRFVRILMLMALLFALAIPAGAASSASQIRIMGTVASDGTAQMTMTATLHMDQPVEELLFPLPASASNITMNGSRVTGFLRDGVRYVNLTRSVGQIAGDFTLTFTYMLEELIVTNEAGLTELQLPLLAGYAYPVQRLEFSITLPGPVDAKPAFSSGYHQADIEKDLSCSVAGATVTGTAQTELKDHETLVMTLSVPEEMFPQNRIAPPDFDTVNTLILVACLAALLFWLLFLRNLPLWPSVVPTPPEGYTAGQLRGVLHLQGADLRLMVFSWAQLGYLQIHAGHQGRVTLYKRMDMGNERSRFEQLCFRLLFRGRSSVDTSGTHYAMVCSHIAKLPANVQSFVHARSGNLYVFRALSALAGLFCGINLSVSLSTDAAVQWLPTIALSVYCLLSSWYIQRWAIALFQREKGSLWLALILAGFWVLLSAMGGLLASGIWAVLGQFAAGLMAAFGGRRTPAGKQAMAQTLGLRRYLKSLSRQQLDFICPSNPDYFHQMMPYALALGVDKRFARSFRNLPVGICPYIQTVSGKPMGAVQWRQLMGQVLQAMTVRQKRNAIEKSISLLRSFVK